MSNTVAQRVACPVCKAKAGDPCRPNGGRCHAERIRFYWATSKLAQAMEKQ